jgi:hypothetical protein
MIAEIVLRISTNFSSFWVSALNTVSLSESAVKPFLSIRLHSTSADLAYKATSASCLQFFVVGEFKKCGLIWWGFEDGRIYEQSVTGTLISVLSLLNDCTPA